MKNHLNVFLLLLTLLITSFSEAQAQQNKRHFKRLHKLEGTWEMQTKKGKLYEVWTKQDAHLLQSRSFRVNGTDTLLQETVALALRDGDIFYTPTVPNQNEGQPVPFKLTKVEGRSYYFENPQHDFPQRIIYDLKSKQNLEVRIDGNTPRGFREMKFVFKKSRG